MRDSLRLRPRATNVCQRKVSAGLQTMVMNVLAAKHKSLYVAIHTPLTRMQTHQFPSTNHPLPVSGALMSSGNATWSPLNHRRAVNEDTRPHRFRSFFDFKGLLAAISHYIEGGTGTDEFATCFLLPCGHKTDPIAKHVSAVKSGLGCNSLAQGDTTGIAKDMAPWEYRHSSSEPVGGKNSSCFLVCCVVKQFQYSLRRLTPVSDRDVDLEERSGSASNTRGCLVPSESRRIWLTCFANTSASD